MVFLRNLMSGAVCVADECVGLNLSKAPKSLQAGNIAEALFFEFRLAPHAIRSSDAKLISCIDTNKACNSREHAVKPRINAAIYNPFFHMLLADNEQQIPARRGS